MKNFLLKSILIILVFFFTQNVIFSDTKSDKIVYEIIFYPDIDKIKENSLS